MLTLPRLFALLLCVAIVRSSIYVDYVQCVEKRQCGLSSICSFVLLAPATMNPKVDLSGYIMRIANGLAVPVTITWDILGTYSASNRTSTPKCGGRVNGTILPNSTTFTLNAYDTRFVNTHCHDIHTIRLQVTNETVDTEIANPEFVCTNDQACEYLVRSCFANNDDPQCKEYATYCQTALKYTNSNIDTFRKACIPNCLAEFYSERVTDPYRYTSDDILDTMMSPYYTMITANGKSTATTLQSHSGLDGGVITAIVLGSVVFLVVTAALGIFFFVRYRRGRLGHL